MRGFFSMLTVRGDTTAHHPQQEAQGLTVTVGGG